MKNWLFCFRNYQNLYYRFVTIINSFGILHTIPIRLGKQCFYGSYFRGPLCCWMSFQWFFKTCQFTSPENGTRKINNFFLTKSKNVTRFDSYSWCGCLFMFYVSHHTFLHFTLLIIILCYQTLKTNSDLPIICLSKTIINQ